MKIELLPVWIVVIGVCVARDPVLKSTGSEDLHHRNNDGVRLEKDYDANIQGESYYYKALYEGKYRYVCYDDHYEDFRAREVEGKILCDEFDFTFGSPYTGVDHEGEVVFHMECKDNANCLQKCKVTKLQNQTCQYHVRMQCMDPKSNFDIGQPLTGWLVAYCVIASMVCILSWIGICVVTSTRTKTERRTSAQTSAYPAYAMSAPPPSYDKVAGGKF